MSWISGGKNHFGCMHYMYLSPFFNPISIDIIQELARNTESQAPLPPPESEPEQDPQMIHMHTDIRETPLYMTLGEILKRALFYHVKSLTMVTTDNWLLTHNSLSTQLLCLLIPCSHVQSSLTMPGSFLLLLLFHVTVRTSELTLLTPILSSLQAPSPPHLHCLLYEAFTHFLQTDLGWNYSSIKWQS